MGCGVVGHVDDDDDDEVVVPPVCLLERDGSGRFSDVASPSCGIALVHNY